MYITPVDKETGTRLIHPNYVFMQYWMYQPGSKSPFLGFDVAQFVAHEGDWEMVQLTIRLKDSKDTDTKHKWVEPFSATASQHFYGQTIGWRRNKKPTDAGEDEIDQNWVNHINNGNRVKIYSALGSHATYFRKGSINSEAVGCGGNDDFIYEPLSLVGAWDEVTEEQVVHDNYTLFPLSGSFINEWEGR